MNHKSIVKTITTTTITTGFVIDLFFNKYIGGGKGISLCVCVVCFQKNKTEIGILNEK